MSCQHAICLLAALLLWSNAPAQDSTLAWSKNLAVRGRGDISTMTPTSDTCYALLGTTDVAGEGEIQERVFLCKINYEGDSLWTEIYVTQFNTRGVDIMETFDGGYLVLAGIVPPSGNSKMLVMRTNARGDTVWTRELQTGSYGSTQGFICPGVDSGSLVGTEYLVSGGGSSDILLAKLTYSGEIVWDAHIRTEYDDIPENAVVAKDGSYLVAANMIPAVYRQTMQTASLSKVSAAGAVLWTRTYENTGLETCKAITATPDSGYILAGGSSSQGLSKEHFCVVRVDKDGHATWNHTYGGADRDICYSIVPQPDSTFILAGTTEDFQVPSSSTRVLQISSTGDSLWSRIIADGDSSEICFQAASSAHDGGTLLVGNAVPVVHSTSPVMIINNVPVLPSAPNKVGPKVWVAKLRSPKHE